MMNFDEEKLFSNLRNAFQQIKINILLKLKVITKTSFLLT